MALTWLDWVFLAVLGISMMVGFSRGLVREGLGLAAWIVALLVARLIAEPVADLFTGVIDNADGRLVLAFVLVIFGVILLCGIMIRMLHAAVEWVGMGFLNRVAGTLFGALRGAAILVLATILITLTPLQQLQAWQQAQLRPSFEQLRDWAVSQIEAWERSDPEQNRDWRNLSFPDLGNGEPDIRPEVGSDEAGSL
ncbi:CvpA family protein [Litchfieldella xinjiangensis]|uniref:CvpA family protein n=1 Tax=Litchfieldella xinjiangensis TaxID=1166948 RepID=UPI0005B98D12|nr:CvpA family protein [Halomonas xinjiangensis]